MNVHFYFSLSLCYVQGVDPLLSLASAALSGSEALPNTPNGDMRSPARLKRSVDRTAQTVDAASPTPFAIHGNDNR